MDGYNIEYEIEKYEVVLDSYTGKQTTHEFYNEEDAVEFALKNKEMFLHFNKIYRGIFY